MEDKLQMICVQMHRIVLVLMLLFGACCDKKTLILEQNDSGFLSANSFHEYIIDIPDRPPTGNLYVKISGVYSDTISTPLLRIKKGEVQYPCASSSPNSLCVINQRQTTPNSRFKLIVQCMKECVYNLVAYQDADFRLSFGEEIPMMLGEPFEASLVVPKGFDQEEVRLLAVINNPDQVESGINLYVNLGQKPQRPTPQYHHQKGISIWNDGVGVFLNDKQLSPGMKIRLYVQGTKDMQATISAITTKNERRNVNLNQKVYDDVEKGLTNKYLLNLSDRHLQKLGNETIFKLIHYTGKVKLSISPTQTLQPGKYIQTNITSSSLQVVLGFATRSRLGFSKEFYLFVEGLEDSTYVLQCVSDELDYIILDEDIEEMSTLEAIGDMDNYVFSVVDNATENQQENVRQVMVRVKVLQGILRYGVRRCRTVEEGRTSGCAIVKESDYQTNRTSFGEIVGFSADVTQSFNRRFQYDIRNCTSKGNGLYFCAFHILIRNPAFSPVTYTMQIEEFSSKLALVDGKPKRDRGVQDQTKQYTFQVIEPTDVLSVHFYLTIISGDCYLTSSLVPYRQNLTESEMKIASNNYISIKQNITNIYYLQVHSLQISHYTLLGIIKRKSNDSALLAPIHLTQGIPQFLSFSPIQSNVSFFIKLDSKKDYYVRANCLKGPVDFQIHPANLYPAPLPVWRSTRQVAHVKNSKSTQFLVLLTSSTPAVCYFVYNKEGVCPNYQLGQRVTVELAEKESTCFSYNVNKTSDIEVLFGTPFFELHTGSLAVTVSFNKGFKTSLTTRTVEFKAKEVEQFCPELSKIGGECKVVFSVQAKTMTTLTTVVRQTNQQFQLLDGLQQYAKGYLSRTRQRQFYYDPQTNTQPMTIVLKSSSDTKYHIVAKIVNWSNYLSSKESLFPKFNHTDFAFADTQVQGSTLLVIGNEKLKQVIPGKNLLLISVFSPSVTEVEASFSIEVSQMIAELRPSEVRLGMVSKFQAKSYLISTKTNEQIIVRTDGSKEDCLKLNLYKQEDNSSIIATSTNNQLVFTPQNGRNDYVVQVIGNSICNYQIFYSPLGSQVFQILHGHPVDLELRPAQLIHLLYHNTRRESFRVISMTEHGDVRLRARSISTSQISTLSQAVQSTNNYEFQDDQQSSSLTISASDQNFCSNCYFLIELTADKPTKATIVLHSIKSAVTLKENRLVKETLGGDSRSSTITYGLMLASAFRLKVEVKEGELKVDVRSTDNSSFSVQRKLNESKIIDVDAPGRRITDLANAGFLIKVTCDNLCSYTLSTDSKTGLFNQGTPYGLAIIGEEQTCAQFKSTASEKESYLFIGSVDASKIKYEVTCRSETAKDCGDDGLVKKQEGNKYTLKLLMNSLEGIYQVCLSLKDPKAVQDATVLLTKNTDFQMLSPNYTLSFPSPKNQAPQLYQMFNPHGKKTIFQLFQCAGQVEHQVTNDYSKLQANLSTVSDHIKTAGHYVSKFNPDVSNPYLFARVQGSKGDFAKYLLKYSFYDGEQSPYSQMEVSSAEILYEIEGENMQFTLENVGGIKADLFEYRVYVAKDLSTLKSAVQCESSAPVLVTTTKKLTKQQNTQDITFNVKLEELNDFLEGHTTNTYLYISASSTITVYEPNSSAFNKYRFIYDTLQVTTSSIEFNNASVFKEKAKYAALWIILPIFFAAILLYLSLKFCCKRVQYLPYSDMSISNVGESAAQIRENAPAETGKILASDIPSEKQIKMEQ